MLRSLQSEEQNFNRNSTIIIDSDDVRKTCPICCKPYSRKMPRVALKCNPSKHQLCSNCVDEIMENAQKDGQPFRCTFCSQMFQETDIIDDPEKLACIDEISRKNSQQVREKKSFEEIVETIYNKGAGILSKSVRKNLINNAGFETLIIKFKAAQLDLNEFVEVRNHYVKLLQSKAKKLKIEQIVKAISLPIEIAGIALAPFTGGSSLIASGASAAIRFLTAILLQTVFSDKKKLVKCTEKCQELAKRPAINEFIIAFEKTEQYLNKEPYKDLLTAFGLQTVSLLLTQAYTIAESVLQFFGAEVFSVCGELLAMLGVGLAGVGAIITGYSIYKLTAQRDQILNMIKIITDQQVKLTKEMENVKKDPRYVAKLEQEVKRADNENNFACCTSFRSISTNESTVIVPSHNDNT